MKKLFLCLLLSFILISLQVQNSWAQQDKTKNLSLPQPTNAAYALNSQNLEPNSKYRFKIEQQLQQQSENWVQQHELQKFRKHKTNPAVACDPQDSSALVQLYFATDGLNWNHNDNWLSGWVYTWYGVTIDSSGRVTQLDLENNNLDNQLPSEIGNLTALTYLNLRQNYHLNGNIPASIGNLSNLQVLDISYTRISGQIPQEIGNLTNLTGLFLISNRLTGNIPSSIGNLTNLQNLNLSGNELDGSIPPEIGNLTNLQMLNLNYNQLSGNIPEEIGNLNNLTLLILEENQLSGNIPASIGNLSNLIVLDLNNNQLSGDIPNTIGQLQNLQYLWIYNNNLTGPIPDEIGNLNNLILLILEKNQLSGNIPASIGNLSNLKYLYLGDNQLTGNIPEAIGNLTNLRTLELQDNKLTGTIPDTLENLTNLEKLNLSDNLLSGNIPDVIGNMSNLQYLYLSNNQLSGPIPESLGNLTNAKYIELDHNYLSGTIPAQLGNLDNLFVLDLSHNQLTGNFPLALTNLTHLRGLNLDHNQLTDSIPSAIVNLTNLYYLNLSYNNFDENKANFSDIFTLLYHLNVSHNRLDFADLETFHAQDARIREFYYSPQAKVSLAVQFISTTTIRLKVSVGGQNNQYQWFNGPTAISGATDSILDINTSDTGTFYCKITNPNFPELTLYSLAYENGVSHLSHGIYKQEYNALKALYDSTSGNNWYHNTNWLTATDVYDWYGVELDGYHVIGLNLQNNNLTGSIPPSIDSLTYLKTLDLSFNNLAGNLTPEIGNIDSLQVLKLNNNQFSGNIPVEIFSLDSLKYLYLDSNQFTGNIPPEIGNLTNLSYLNLNGNQFTGNIPAALNNLSNLIYLYLRYNQLTGAESDLSSLPTLYFVFIDHNKLQFGALDTLYIHWDTIAGSYSPQDSVLIFNNVDPANEQVQLNVQVSGLHNHYQWFYNDEPIDGATASSLNFGFHDRPAGIYYCQITNPDYPLLTLTSHKYEYKTLNFVKFVVTDGTNPLPGAWVAVGDDSLQTDDNGQASFILLNGAYTYNIHKNGYAPLSDSINVLNKDTTVNIVLTYTNVNNLSSSIKIYPNPVTNLLHISAPVTNAKVLIYDLHGRKLYEQILSNHLSTIDLSHFSSGTYMLKIVTGDRTFVYKITKL